MLRRYERRFHAGVALTAALLVGWGAALAARPDRAGNWGWAAGVVLAFGYGCVSYTRAKGYPGWCGLFGLTLVGFLVLAALPDRDPPPADPGPRQAGRWAEWVAVGSFVSLGLVLAVAGFSVVADGRADPWPRLVSGAIGLLGVGICISPWCPPVARVVRGVMELLRG